MIRNEFLKIIKTETENIEFQKKCLEELKIFCVSCKKEESLILKDVDVTEEKQIENKKRVTNLGDSLDTHMELLEIVEVKTPEIFIYLLKAQASINRLSHRVANIKIEKRNKNMEFLHDRVEGDVKNLQNNIITIVSLIFAAFTIIQINFTAFQDTNKYEFLDRIILFGAVNIFVILGIFAIFAMIKSIIKTEKNSICILLKLRFFIPVLLLFGVVGYCYNEKKNIDLDFKYKPKIDYYDNLISLKKENLENLKNEINLTEEKIESMKRSLKEINNEISKKIIVK